MSLQVAVIDKSEITKKMLSHCLYYFLSEVSRFDNWTQCKKHFSDKKPDIIFVDLELKEDEKSVVHKVIEENLSIPIILMYRPIDVLEANAIQPSQLTYKLIKPLNPDLIRKHFVEWIPGIKEGNMYSFLKFPKNKKTENDSNDPDDPDEQTLFPYTQPQIKILTENHKTQTSEEKELTLSRTGKPGAEGSFQGRGPESLKDKLLQGSQNYPGQHKPEEPSLENPNPQKDLSEMQKTEFSHGNQPNQTSRQLKTRTFAKITRKGFKLDENPQGDFAPMTIHSQDLMTDHVSKDNNIHLNEDLIVKVLNKYKDSLEFQKIIEKTLNQYAREFINQLLTSKLAKDSLKESLEDFKETRNFKEMVLRESQKYMKEQLPLKMKEIIEKEIKKILEN